ncbi:probable G-protein coupled receptor 34 [Boleophthalmus pectinirostris]|uniref:probable G-protein coupled receptor 34 n=1 Tax=Boleophthalmus pectinirostris TaxID=150288 RepID=UPI000A1C56C8|nr:probable G-protein coupled receptor 34 [Boleophthalmus pectinirostris]
MNLNSTHTFNSSISSIIYSTTDATSLSANPPPVCNQQNEAFNWILAVVYSLFFIFGLIGNLFALWVFIFLQASRNSVRVFLINCAVADLVLLACLPFRIFYHANGNKWVLGSVACKAVGNLFYMNMYISIALLGCISLDRYLRLRGKGRAKRGIRIRLCGRSWPWSWVVCTCLWTFSILALVPMIATAEDKEFDNKCFQYKPRNKGAKGKAYFNGALVIMFWIVFLTMMVSYARVAAQLLKVSRDKPDLPNAQRYQRTAKKSFFVLFLFTICFGPYHAFRPIYIFSQLQDISCDYIQLMNQSNEVMLLFSAFNSCLDPIMYFILSGSVRKTAFKTIGRGFSARLVSLNDATSNSSTIDYRRQSVPFVSPGNDSTPRSSGIVNSTRKTSLVTAHYSGNK